MPKVCTPGFLSCVDSDTVTTIPVVVWTKRDSYKMVPLWVLIVDDMMNLCFSSTDTASLRRYQIKMFTLCFCHRIPH